MDGNHWRDNDQHKSTPKQEENGYGQEYSYTNSYTYESNNTQDRVPRSVSGGTRQGGRVALLVGAAVLMLALCLGAGTLGSLISRDWGTSPDVPLSDTPDASDPTPDKDAVTAPELPSTSPDAANPMSSPVADVNRNPLPEMDKRPTLGKVTYTGSAGDDAYSTLAEAIDMVDETVVEIFTETIVSGGWLGNFVQDGAGSGVIISEDGYIVTNNHVISGAVTITVRMTDGTTYEAQLVGTDASTDIAVLWVDSEQPLPAAELGCSADLIVGEYVYAIGNPLGSLGGTVTDGIISATARSIAIDGQQMTLLQTNAAVNPGNSGGGLFNMAGQLIGVVNAKCSEDDVEGLGFAIPIDTAYDVICQLIEYGYVRGIVDTGLELYEVSSSNILVALRYFGMSHTGLYVMESEYSTEIKYGDLLVSVNDVSVQTDAEVKAAFEGLMVGDTVTLRLLRREIEHQNGREVAVEREITVELVLQEYVPEDASIRFEAK